MAFGRVPNSRSKNRRLVGLDPGMSSRVRGGFPLGKGKSPDSSTWDLDLKGGSLSSDFASMLVLRSRICGVLLEAKLMFEGYIP